MQLYQTLKVGPLAVPVHTRGLESTERGGEGAGHSQRVAELATSRCAVAGLTAQDTSDTGRGWAQASSGRACAPRAVERTRDMKSEEATDRWWFSHQPAGQHLTGPPVFLRWSSQKTVGPGDPRGVHFSRQGGPVSFQQRVLSRRGRPVQDASPKQAWRHGPPPPRGSRVWARTQCRQQRLFLGLLSSQRAGPLDWGLQK